MSWSRQGDKPLSVPMMVSLLAHICVTRHQWINPEFALPDFGYYHIVSCLNSLWSSDAIWRHRSELTLARIMSCCLTASNHYLNKSCFIIESVLWHSTGRNFTRTVHDLYRSMRSEITLTKLSPHLPGANELSLKVSLLCIFWTLRCHAIGWHKADEIVNMFWSYVRCEWF